MTRTALLAVLPLLLSSTAAFSEATEDGALHLKTVFQTYLGTSEGVVSVEVDGGDYVVTLDPAPLAKMAADAGGSASLTPFKMTLNDNGDGTWDVSQDQALTLTVSMPGALDMTEEIGSMTFNGVFDESLMSFASFSGKLSDLKVTETVSQPNQGDMKVEMSLASGTFEGSSKVGANGGVDSTSVFAGTGLSETLMTPASDGMPAMPITITAESMTQTGDFEGFRPDAFYKSVAWLVSNSTDDLKEANKPALKAILMDGLPLFGNLSGTGTITKLDIATPMGNFGIAEVGIGVDANGAVADGKLRESISISGLTLPSGVVPEWAQPILPQSASIDFQVTDFDAEAAGKVLLSLLDLPKGVNPDAAFEGNLVAALMPNNTVTIGLNPGSIAGDGYELTYTGSMVAGPNLPIPTGKATITLTGIEKLQAALAAAPDDVKGQAMMGMGMAQGMAKPGENGALVWEIDASTPGSLSVNGTPLMGGN